MKLATDDYDSGAWCLTHGGYGYEIPDELWERYEAAEALMGEIVTEMFACPYRSADPPKPGTLGRVLYDNYRAGLIASLRQSSSLYTAYHDQKKDA